MSKCWLRWFRFVKFFAYVKLISFFSVFAASDVEFGRLICRILLVILKLQHFLVLFDTV